jgi:hypothetical protein
MDPDCWGGWGPDAVFVFALEDPSEVVIDTFGSSFDTVLYVRADHCTAGPQAECNDDMIGQQSEIIMPHLDPGMYFIFLDGFSEWSEGEYILNIFIEPLEGAEICDDGEDNDGDGMVDCDDEDCDRSPYCRCVPEPEMGVEACTDGEDNDCDGMVDCDDWDDCAVVWEVDECCNGVDDNGDPFGLVDEFACRCWSNTDCEGDYVCHWDTAGACGPRCDSIPMSDFICDFFFPGSTCDEFTGRCTWEWFPWP